MIVEELWAAVPESGFVFVAFENHFSSLPEAIALAEILGDAADEKSWLLSGGVENPGKHRSSSGFSVRAADDNGMFSGKKNFFQNFRHGAIKNLTAKCLFKFRIAASDDISDDDEIRRWRELRRVKRGEIGDAKIIEKRGRRRVDAGVGASYAKALFAQHSGERSHGRAANSDDVNMFCQSPFSLSHSMTAGSRISSVPLPRASRRARTPRGKVNIGRAVWPIGAP